MCDTGWRRLVRCLRVYVIFRKRTTNYGALLRKMTYEDKGSYGSSPPCIEYTYTYGVATISRLLKSIGLFCKRALQKRRYSRHRVGLRHHVPTGPVSRVLYGYIYIYVWLYIDIYRYIDTSWSSIMFLIWLYIYICIYIYRYQLIPAGPVSRILYNYLYLYVYINIYIYYIYIERYIPAGTGWSCITYLI